MNNTDKAYQDLLKRILSQGKLRGDRTGTGTISIFSHTLEMDMADGFPLLTTKKMFTRGIIHELLWFLNGDTNIQYLVKNGVNIWTPDAYREYEKGFEKRGVPEKALTMEYFKDMITEDDYFAKEHGELGPVYGKQWVKWGGFKKIPYVGCLHKREGVWCIKWSDLHSFGYGHHWSYTDIISSDQSKYNDSDEGRKVSYTRTTLDYDNVSFIPNDIATVIDNPVVEYTNSINQIQQVIDKLNNKPEDRRIMVSAWNVGEIDEMALPPCHYGFELYTEELTLEERLCEADKFNELIRNDCLTKTHDPNETEELKLQYRMEWLDSLGVIPKRRLSLKWHQRSVDSFLGLPFNIASYGLLLHMFAQQTNMVAGKLIGDLTNVHIYKNHVEQCEEQISREPLVLPTLTLEKAVSIFNYSYENVKINDYSSHPSIKGDISV